LGYTTPIEGIMTNRIEQGGCLCGAVRYRFSGEAKVNDICHCRSCRLSAGAPLVAWTVVRAADFAFVAGEPATFASSPGVTRTFCGICGTSLTYRDESRPDSVDLTTATLDAPERFVPTFEIWTEEKIPWVTTNPALRQYRRSSKSE
jgi:hypothetical protein